MYILQKYLKDLISVYEAVPQSLGTVQIDTAKVYSYPILDVGVRHLMFDTVYILRHHGHSSYITKVNLDFQMAKRILYGRKFPRAQIFVIVVHFS